MNWGGFAGGFAQGLNQTFDVKGLSRYMLSPEYRQQKVLADAAAEARAAEAPEAPTMVDAAKTTGISGQAPEKAPEPVKVETPPVAAPTTTPVPENPESTVTPGSGARAIAESSTPPVAEKATPVAEPATPPTQATMAQSAGVAGAQPKQAAQPAQKTPAQVESFLYSKVLPNAKNKLIEMGDLEGAAKLEAHIESARGKQAMAVYGKAYNALTYGNDVNKAVQLFGEYYNKFVDDGVDFTKGEVTKDGQIAITTKNKADGAENTMTLSRGQLLRMGMAYNPVKLYEMNLTEAVDAEKQGAKTRGEIAKEDRQHQNKIELMTIEKQLDAANVTAGERRKLDAKIGALRSAGYSDEFINGALPGLLGIGDYKKSTSPEEARRLAHSDRMKNDPMYARKPADQQAKILDQDMAIVYAGGKPTATPGAGAPSTPAPAASQGLPKAGAGKIPVYDTKTGQIVYK